MRNTVDGCVAQWYNVVFDPVLHSTYSYYVGKPFTGQLTAPAQPFIGVDK